MKYSCEDQPQDYNVINKRKQLPLPKNGNTYLWHVANFTDDMDKFKVIYSLAQVFNELQRSFDMIHPIGQIINLASTQNIQMADIVISFGSLQHEMHTKDGIRNCPGSFDGNNGVLAHAWSLEERFPFGGQMHFDDAEKWGRMHSDVDGLIQLFTVALHEACHLFGVSHSSIEDAVSYGRYTGPKSKLHVDDIKSLAYKITPLKYKLLRTAIMPEQYSVSFWSKITSKIKSIFR